MFLPYSSPSAALIARETNPDGNGQSGLSAGAIIVIVLVAAGFAVLVGFAGLRFFYNADKDHNPFAQGDEQQIYMREVRLRNVQDLSSGRGNKQSYAAEREVYPYPSHGTGVSTPTSFVSKE